MRHGLFLDVSRPVPDVVADVRRMADAGISFAISSQIFGYDALTLLALAGREVSDIELMTNVVPTYPRHPVVLAAQALTVQAATGGRLVLGIGVSHQVVVENVFGHPFERPVRHMREYLAVLLPVLRGEQVTFAGETVRANTFGPIEIAAPAPAVILAALGPRMLELAGSVADGTTTWMTGPRTVADHIVPSIQTAAEREGRPPPRVAVSLPVCVTNDPDGARQQAALTFGIYGGLPSYRAMLDREGAEGPADVVLAGDEDEVARQVVRITEAGATDFGAAPFGAADEQARTFDLMAQLNKAA